MSSFEPRTATVPAYLNSVAATYASNPRQAALDWFREARFGLFLHYGLYSLVAGDRPGQRQDGAASAEWIQQWAPIPRAEYARLADDFTAEHFDADAICQMAKAAGMRYVNLTTQHHDGFSLWDTATNRFSSVHAAARRDLVAELSEACHAHGLGCFLYYSHGRDWYHPDAPFDGNWSCRPANQIDSDHFHYGDDVVVERYFALVEAQVAELCAYPNVAGIWLDGIGTFKPNPEPVVLEHCQRLYDQIHAAAPHLLVSYKQGLTGTEDFFAPERSIKPGALADDNRPKEICTTLQPHSWGYHRDDDGHHHGPEWVLEQLQRAAEIPANLLLNTGPYGDGRIPPEDVATLEAVGAALDQG